MQTAIRYRTLNYESIHRVITSLYRLAITIAKCKKMYTNDKLVLDGREEKKEKETVVKIKKYIE